jgi:hypothetical protein
MWRRGTAFMTASGSSLTGAALDEGDEASAG